MSVKDLELKQAYDVFVDAWKTYREYTTEELTEERAEKLEERLYQMAEKYDNHEFAMTIMRDTACEINNVWKRKHRKE